MGYWQALKKIYTKASVLWLDHLKLDIDLRLGVDLFEEQEDQESHSMNQKVQVGPLHEPKFKTNLWCFLSIWRFEQGPPRIVLVLSVNIVW